MNGSTLALCLAALALPAGYTGEDVAGLPDAIVGSHLVREARAALARRDAPLATALLEESVQYRDTVVRRRMLAALAEERGELAVALAHLRRARELEPSVVLARELARLDRLVRPPPAADPSAGATGAPGTADASDAPDAADVGSPGSLSSVPPASAAPSTAPAAPMTPEAQVAALLGGLGSSSDLVRRRSAQALGQMGAKAAMPLLVKMAAEDRDDLTRMDAVDALAALGGEEGLAHLFEQLFKEKDELVIDRLLDGIVRLGGVSTAYGLEQYLATDAPDSFKDRVRAVLEKFAKQQSEGG